MAFGLFGFFINFMLNSPAEGLLGQYIEFVQQQLAFVGCSSSILFCQVTLVA